MTIERTYRTGATPEELASAFTQHFAAHGFQTVVSRTGQGGMLINASRTSPWHEVMGLARKLEISIMPAQGALAVQVREDGWQHDIGTAATTVAAFPPALIGAGYEFWRKRQLESGLWRIIDQRAA